MSEPLSGLQGLSNFKNLNNAGNLNNIGFGNFNKLDNFLTKDEALQGPESITQMSNGINKIDFSKVDNNNDPELKADLKGLVQKNQGFDDSSGFGNSEMTTGDVANKFSDVLGNYLNNVNQQNKTAEKAVETFASGGNIDLHSVMIASEKANLSMELALQLKNKIVQAYQEISRTQV